MTNQRTRRRRKISLFLSLCLLFVTFGTLGVCAESPPPGAADTPVLLNGKEILQGEALRIEGTTYIPLRRFCVLMGADSIAWDGRTGTATVKAPSLTLTVRTGDLYVCANGRYLWTVGTIRNLNGSLYVPIRPLAKAFALDLEWDAANCRVLLKKTARSAIEPASYPSDAVYWLSRIISSEARGEPFAGQVAVGNVVLNRVRSASYPDTIWGVIFDRKYGVQFSPVSFGTIYNSPSESAVIAAKVCLEGYSVTNDALFFVNPRLATNNWIQRSRPYLFTIGSHDFYA